MRAVVLQTPRQRWYCPNCVATDTTCTPYPHTRFHRCPGVAGLEAPMLPAGVRGKVEAREREDYISGDDVRLDGNGRPVMSLVTTRDDGQDCTVFAPTAHGKVEA